MARMPYRSLPKAVEFDIEALINPGGKSGFLCLSETTWEMAYNMVLSYGEWRSRYYYTDPSTGDKLEITDAEYDTIRQTYQLALEELQMAGCDDLTNLLSDLVGAVGAMSANLSAALSQDQCCTPVGPPLPDEPPVEGDPMEDDPPEGFGDWEEFFLYKCAASNRIADDWIETIGNLSSLSGVIGAISALALAAFLNTSLLSGILVGLIAVGFSAFTAGAIVIGALVALVAGGAGLFVYFGALSTAMDGDRETLVCGIFDSTTVSEAATFIQEFTSDLAVGLDYDPEDDDSLFQSVLSDLAGALLSTASLNVLYIYDEATANYPQVTDCGACGSNGYGCDLHFQLGEDGNPRGSGTLERSSVQYTITATFDTVAGFYYVAVNVGDLPNGLNHFDDCSNMDVVCQGETNERFRLEWELLTGTINAGIVGAVCENGSHSANNPTSQFTLYNLSWYEMISTVPFTIRATHNLALPL